jgi:nucleoside-diphosphate-sugar epimerase
MRTLTQVSCLLGLFATTAAGLSPPPTTLTKVLVTGAAGRTGQLVFGSLLEDSRFEAKALVRSEKSGKKLRKVVPATGLNQIVVCDVTTLGDEPTLPGLEEFKAMIICTSAVPTISKLSLVKAFLKIPLNLIRRKKAFDFRSLSFVWKKGQYPEKVDYKGQMAQIDLAKKLGMKHVVVVGSMGGTDPTNFLNSIGKKADGSGNGDILLWKRKAERYLVDSGLDYTIIHPGGLTDTPPGQEVFVLDVDDKLIVNKKRSISRGDVADLCIAALTVAKGKKVALDCITRVPEPGDKVASAEEALTDFLKESKTYDYAL